MSEGGIERREMLSLNVFVKMIEHVRVSELVGESISVSDFYMRACLHSQSV
jgi:hypothetical protein